MMVHIAGVETAELCRRFSMHCARRRAHALLFRRADIINQFTTSCKRQAAAGGTRREKRGVLFDIGHGGGSSTTRCEAAIAQARRRTQSPRHPRVLGQPRMPYLTW